MQTSKCVLLMSNRGQADGFNKPSEEAIHCTRVNEYLELLSVFTHHVPESPLGVISGDVAARISTEELALRITELRRTIALIQLGWGK